MKKRTFTIIELIIVMTILGIMFLMTKNYFSSENQIYYEGETCINNFYYTIKDLNNAALLGRSRVLSGVFDSGADYITTPDRYTVVFRAPGFIRNPQFPASVEETSGLVKLLKDNPLNNALLGTYTGKPFFSYNLASRAYLYRGTGDVTKTLNTGLETYSILYLPIRGINYLPTLASGGYTPFKGCANNEYFVTFAISTPYSNETALRVGFQNSSSTDTRKKMIIRHTQRASGTMAEADTGAITLQVCNNSVQCKETHRIFFDTRVNDVFLQKCIQYGADRKCTSRQGGDIN